MSNQQLIKKTVRLTEDVALIVDSKPQPTQFMRNAIEKEVVRSKKGKTKITIGIKFAGAVNYDDTLKIVTYATGRLKEKLSPLLDAVENLQEVILYLDC